MLTHPYASFATLSLSLLSVQGALVLALLGHLMPVLLGALSSVTFHVIESAGKLEDRLPPGIKVIAVGVLAFVFVQVKALTGVELPGDLSLVTPEQVMVALTFLSGLALHAIAKVVSPSAPVERDAPVAIVSNPTYAAPGTGGSSRTPEAK